MSLSNLSSTSAALPAVSEQADSEPVMFAGAAKDPSDSASKKQKVITQNTDLYSCFKENG